MDFSELFYLTFTALYCLFFFYLISPWITIKRNLPKEKERECTGISVVIPFRNEEAHLPYLLESVALLNSVNIEVLLVNDHSTDGGVGVIQPFISKNSSLKLLQLNDGESGKKSAISKGISASQFEFIVTTDADCVFHPDWLKEHIEYFEGGSDFQSGMVKIHACHSFFDYYQQLDLMAVQGVGFGMGIQQHPITASGANLGYSKSLFESLQPYERNIEVASGDDIYFLQEVKKNKIPVGYLTQPNSIVSTHPVSWKAFIQQRLRWMKKGSSFTDPATVFTGIFLVLSSLIFLFGAVYQFIQGQSYAEMLIYMTFKMGFDFLLLFLVARHFGNKQVLYFFLPSFVLNMIFMVFFFLFGWFIPVNWKSRSV